MSVKKRQCGTCRFFVQSDTPGFGTCTNPAWPDSSAPLLLVRPSELACRTRWGTSLWQDPSDMSTPGIAAAPQQPSLPEPPSVQQHYDDEVTSVSIAGSARGRSSFDDDVVDTSTVVPSSVAWNDDDLQSERRELLRQGTHDAVAGARKRHIDKQARQRELVPFADDDAPNAIENPEPDAVEPTPAARDDRTPSFRPDDFVEDERGSADDVYDDEIVDEGVPGSRRSPRINNLLKHPKNGKAMTLGAASEMAVTLNNPEQREQWNTVPSVQPGFSLPFADTVTPLTPQPNVRVAASAAPSVSSAPVSRPVSVAREMYTEDRKQVERAQRRSEAPLADSAPSHDRDKLSHAPSSRAPLVERIKSSPLRGYHPTPKSQDAPTEHQTKRRAPEPPATTPGRPLLDEHVAEQPVARRERNQTQAASPAPMPRPSHPEMQDTDPQAQPETAAREERRPEKMRRPMIALQVQAPFVQNPVQLAPSVPRCCGTCSSYRASDVPGRGSCANQFAGPLRRMVSDTDLACEHTWGTMWLPADNRVWLTDLPDHSAPTPRIDAWLHWKEQDDQPVLPDLDELTS